MAKGIREFNKRLGSLRNTLKMTKTMKMVSASKLRRAQAAQRHSHAYAERTNELIAHLVTAVGAGGHPLFTPREHVKKALVLVLTSDRGLCGAFNNQMIRQVSQWVALHASNYQQLDVSFCGRRGFNYFQRRLPVRRHYEGMTASPSFKNATTIAEELMDVFLKGEYDEVFLAYNVFNSPLSQTPTFQKLLPIEAREFSHRPTVDRPLEYLFEPPLPELVATLVPKTVKFKIYYALLENAAGEHGARMTAMDNATSNCEKMIDHYTLMRNRARQAAITTELIEIISGAEAL